MADEHSTLKVPAGYFDMTPAEQAVAAKAMWQDAMRQMGRDPETGGKREPSVDTYGSAKRSAATKDRDRLRVALRTAWNAWRLDAAVVTAAVPQTSTRSLPRRWPYDAASSSPRRRGSTTGWWRRVFR
jgi:hypothetical protein